MDPDRRIHAGMPGDPVARRIGSYEVIETLSDGMLFRGIPEHIRSDNRPELVAKQATGVGGL